MRETSDVCWLKICFPLCGDCIWQSIIKTGPVRFLGIPNLWSRFCRKGSESSGLARHGLHVCVTFEQCVWVNCGVYTRTVYVWLCMARQHNGMKSSVSPSACTQLRFLSARRAGRRGLFIFLFAAFCFPPSRFPQSVLLAELSHPLKLIHIVHLLCAAQKIKAKRRLVKNCADRNLIGWEKTSNYET